MDADRDYYAVLGVLPSVDPTILQAVYRVFVKRFHPDVTGQADSTDFRAVTEAYEVLSDPAKRAAYDALRRKRNEHAGRFEQSAEARPGHWADQHRTTGPLDAETDEAWKIVQEYEPKAAKLECTLRKLSDNLGLVFRSMLMRKRDFAKATVIAEELEQEFLERYFGEDETIQDFARELLLSGEPNGREAAKELNHVIRTLGTMTNADDTIQHIIRKYGVRERRSWGDIVSLAKRRGWNYTKSTDEFTRPHSRTILRVGNHSPEAVARILELDE